MHLLVRATCVDPRRSLDTGEITRRASFTRMMWEALLAHPQDAAVVDIIRRSPMIVEITGRRCLSMSFALYFTRDTLCSSRHVGAQNQLADQTRFHCGAMQLVRGFKASRRKDLHRVSDLSAPSEKRGRIAISSLTGLSFDI